MHKAVNGCNDGDDPYGNAHKFQRRQVLFCGSELFAYLERNGRCRGGAALDLQDSDCDGVSSGMAASIVILARFWAENLEGKVRARDLHAQTRG